MLSKSLGLISLWFAYSLVKGQDSELLNCTVEDEELPEVQSGLNNFVIDEMGTVLFPYALNQCTATSVITTGRWSMFECSMDSNGISTVTKTEYLTEDCSDAGSIVAVYNETGMTEGEAGYFECGGSDTYTRIRLSLDSDCESTVVVYAGLGACANTGANSQLNVFCSAEGAIIQIFLGESMMTTTFLPSSTAFNGTFNDTALPTEFNETLFPTQFNATLQVFNVTLPEFNATLPELNATIVDIMTMCGDEAFCDKWIISRECNLLTTAALGASQGIYGIFEECFTDTGVTFNSTMLPIFNTTFDDNITATEPTVSSSTSTSTSTTRGTETTTSGAMRPSLLFTAGMFFSFFFLVSV